MAIIIPDHQLTFIHIPKTAGSSIQKWLADNTECTLLKRSLHSTVKDIKERIDNLGTTFCVVRDPYDWAVSWYEYEKKHIARRIEKIESGSIKNFKINNQKDNLSVLYEKKIELERLTFEDFVKRVNKPPQVKWAKDVDIILRFEHLEKDFKKIQKITGCKVPLEKINPTVRSRTEDYYTRKLKKIIYKKYREDFDFLANL
jgi:hypothetical protein